MFFLIGFTNMIEYILLILFIIIVSITVYIKLKYGFWYYQPVFHIYNLNYMIFPPGIIRNYLPEKNKYTNFKNIETIIYDNVTEIEMNSFINFVKLNYLRNNDNIYDPDKNNVVPYFIGHNTMSFFSFYRENTIIKNLKDDTLIEDKKIIGVMTSRPIYVTINNGIESSNFKAYYVDYLCVDKSYRKKGIAPQIIQTHHYNQSHLNKNIVVSLFKREDELTGIVPLCVYSTYGFNMEHWIKPLELNNNYKLLEITPQNLFYLNHFIKDNSKHFDIIINTDVSNIVELLKTKNIYIYAVIIHEKIICVYFYRKSCTFIDKNSEVLSCFASINNCDDKSIFIHGFKLSVWNVLDKNKFKVSAIENISHNNLIINNLLLKNKPFVISPTAYFFYNFAYPTFNSKKVLII